MNDEKSIKQLKKDLISTKKSNIPKDNDNDNSSKTVRDIISEEKGVIFEDNIRETLIKEYNFKKLNFQIHNYYREIIFGETNEIVLLGEVKNIKIKNNDYTFHLNKDYSLTVTQKDNKYNSFDYNKEQQTTIIDGENIILKPFKEIEMDELYSVDNFNVNMFNPDEVCILYNTVKKENENNIKNIVMEIKLNNNKIRQMISQFQKDKTFMEKITNEKLIFIGFVNGNNAQTYIKKEAKDIEFIIYGIKDKKFCGRNMIRCIDWKNVSDIKDIKKDITDIRKDITNIKKDITDIKSDITEIKNIINSLISEKDKKEEWDVCKGEGEKIKKWLGKKTGPGGA